MDEIVVSALDGICHQLLERLERGAGILVLHQQPDDLAERRDGAAA